MLFTKCLGKDRKYLLTIACFCEQRPIYIDVGLQNDEAECRYEMHGAGVVS